MNPEKEKQSSTSSFPPSFHTNTKVVHVARIVLGLVFLVFGVNGFVHVIPLPAMPAPAQSFYQALSDSGYLMFLVHATEVVAGALLLANRFVPLALTLLAPVIVNIVAFHVFLTPNDLALAFVVLTLEIFLARAYLRAYRSMLKARNSPEGTLEPISSQAPLSR